MGAAVGYGKCAGCGGWRDCRGTEPGLSRNGIDRGRLGGGAAPGGQGGDAGGFLAGEEVVDFLDAGVSGGPGGGRHSGQEQVVVGPVGAGAVHNLADAGAGDAELPADGAVGHTAFDHSDDGGFAFRVGGAGGSVLVEVRAGFKDRVHQQASPAAGLSNAALTVAGWFAAVCYIILAPMGRGAAAIRGIMAQTIQMR